MKEDDFININIKDNSSKVIPGVNATSHNTASNNSSTNNNSSKPEPQKLREKLGQKFQSGKRKLLGMGGENPSNAQELDVPKGNKKSSTYSEGDMESALGTNQQAGIKNGSQSAKSSPHKQALGDKRQRALSDTNLSKV